MDDSDLSIRMQEMKATLIFLCVAGYPPDDALSRMQHVHGATHTPYCALHMRCYRKSLLLAVYDREDTFLLRHLRGSDL